MARLTRIHLGCGDKYWPGFKNVDLVGDPDIKSDIMELEIESGTVDEIHAIHLFEHIPRTKILAALKEWKRVLKKGGKLILEMPSMDKIAQHIVNGANNPRLTLLGIFGDPREENPYMAHKWCYTNEELKAVLEKSGFSVVFEEPKFHIKRRDLRVSCRSD